MSDTFHHEEKLVYDVIIPFSTAYSVMESMILSMLQEN